MDSGWLLTCCIDNGLSSYCSFDEAYIGVDDRFDPYGVSRRGQELFSEHQDTVSF
jgi:hypothetical protein